MLFKPIDTEKLLNNNWTEYKLKNKIKNEILSFTDYSKSDYESMDKINNIVCICPGEKKQNNKIKIDDDNIVFCNNCDINLSTLVNLVTPNTGAVKLLFKFKLILPSEFKFDFYIEYPFISKVFKKYITTKTEFGYTIYSNVEIILYIDLLMLRQYKLPFEIVKDTKLMYLHVFPLLPINKNHINTYILYNTELFNQDNKYL